jgi:hypothetical protein
VESLSRSAGKLVHSPFFEAQTAEWLNRPPFGEAYSAERSARRPCATWPSGERASTRSRQGTPGSQLTYNQEEPLRRAPAFPRAPERGQASVSPGALGFSPNRRGVFPNFGRRRPNVSDESPNRRDRSPTGRRAPPTQATFPPTRPAFAPTTWTFPPIAGAFALPACAAHATSRAVTEPGPVLRDTGHSPYNRPLPIRPNGSGEPSPGLRPQADALGSRGMTNSRRPERSREVSIPYLVGPGSRDPSGRKNWGMPLIPGHRPSASALG